MKTVLITGIGRGIGKALADKFIAEGFYVVGTVLNTPSQGKQNLRIVTLDLASHDSISACVKELTTNGTKIDILINNAGILLDENDTALIPEKLRGTLEVNLTGTAAFTESLLPSMNTGGHIVFISSAAGSINDMDDIDSSHFPYHYPAYKISKAALNMYARTLAVRLKNEKVPITVSCVHPGWVRTDMGGDEAPTSPNEAARDIYNLAVSQPETGQFWYKGAKHPW